MCHLFGEYCNKIYDCGLCLGVIHRILKKFSAYKYLTNNGFEELLPGDKEFCQLFTYHNNVLKLILWANEAISLKVARLIRKIMTARTGIHPFSTFVTLKNASVLMYGMAINNILKCSHT